MGKKRKIRAGQAQPPSGGEAKVVLSDSVEQQSPVSSMDMVPGFDRLGGLDGFMSIVSKLQQVFGLINQMRPAIQLLGTFMGPKAAVNGFSSKQMLKGGKTLKTTKITTNSNRKRKS